MCTLVPFSILVSILIIFLQEPRHVLAAVFYFIMCLPFIACQREKEKKSLHQQILKDDLTRNGLELYCCQEILVRTTFITYSVYLNWFLDQTG